eukprot:scaffold1164_cov141-Chaetoceros_neogracile.AAC.1
MSDPIDTSSNREYSTCLEEESESISRQKRQCRSSSPIAAQPASTTTAVVSNEKTIFDIPDAVLAFSFAFVGKGTFRYTASVCKTFHKVYKSAFHDTTDTSMESAVASIACAEMFLQENDGGLEINTNIDIDIDRKALYIWNGAARNGRVEILEWMNKSEYSNCFDIKTGDLAAEHGHLDALMWFHKNGCPVDKATFAMAAWGGEVDDWE